MWTKEITDMIINGVWATLYMTVASTVLGYVFGLPMGVLLAITDKEGLTPNAVVYKILDVIANIVRSIPFLILLILLIHLRDFLLDRVMVPLQPLFHLLLRRFHLLDEW